MQETRKEPKELAKEIAVKGGTTEAGIKNLQNNNIDKKSFSMIWIHIGWPKNLERMKITNEILSKKVFHVAHISVPDKVPKNLTSLFFLINYIDWLSYWCGVLNDVDIDAVKSIDLLKKKIS